MSELVCVDTRQLAPPAALVFEATPLAAFAANATFLFENTALAPRTAKVYAAFNKFFATDPLWHKFGGDGRRHQMVRDMWNSVAKAIPLSNSIVPVTALEGGHWVAGVARGPFDPFVHRTTEWPQREKIPCLLSIISCLGELQDELRERPDVLAKPLPNDVPIKIDWTTQVSLTLRELFGMVFGATVVRADADPRLSGIGLLGHDSDIYTLTLLASALEGDPPLLTADNIKVAVEPRTMLILPIGAVITACQRAYASYSARSEMVGGLALY